VQAEPPAAPAPAPDDAPPAPDEAPPAAEALPQILPAPDMPGDDPVVELPPAGEAPAGPAPAGPPVRDGAIFSFADLAEGLLDSVVYISTSQRVEVQPRVQVPDMPDAPSGEDFFDDFFDDGGEGGSPDPRAVQSLGSGFVIDASGYIVTNNHVIADADEIVANFTDGRKLVATVVGVDDKTDLALLKVESPAPLKAAKFGRSERMRVGDWVLAIGNPFGFGGSVTAGIVSALDRDINSGPYDHYIQTDASINRGNSGGPLFNIDGEVVGINTAIMSPTGGSIGIGFSVPSEIAVPVIEQLRRFGEVRRGWIGVRIQDVTDDIARSIGLDKAAGALIAGMTEDGPAARGGLKEGDVVIEFAGKEVATMRALPRLVADTPPGDTVELTVMRDGERITLSIEIGLLEDDAGKQASAATPEEAPEASPETSPDAPPDAAQASTEVLGLSLAPLTDEARARYSIAAGVKGVLVASVETGSEAERKSLKPGEVIVRVSQTEVATPQDVVARIEELQSEGRKTAMLLVSGENNKLRFVSLRFEEPAQP
jgi:serine protease Do